MDFSVRADRDCLVAFAAVVLCSDRGVEARKSESLRAVARAVSVVTAGWGIWFKWRPTFFVRDLSLRYVSGRGRRVRELTAG
jgi:hypothetical protein